MKKSLLLGLFFLLALSLFSQSNSSLIFGLGPNKMSGDIGGDNFGSLLKNDMGVSTGIAYRFVFPFNIGLRVFGGYDLYRGKDKQNYNENRTHYFNSSVGTLGGQLEYIIFGNNYIRNQKPHSLYIFAGAEKALYGALVDGTTKVSGNSLGLFGGLGYQYRVNDNISFGLELKQALFDSDKVDGYDADRNYTNNKYNDMAFDAKIVICYNIPIYSGPKHWNTED